MALKFYFHFAKFHLPWCAQVYGIPMGSSYSKWIIQKEKKTSTCTLYSPLKCTILNTQGVKPEMFYVIGNEKYSLYIKCYSNGC